MLSFNEELEFVRGQINLLRIREQELGGRNSVHAPSGNYSCHICRSSLTSPLGHLAYPPHPIDCPICFESTDPIMVLSCGHFICRDCFKGFFGLCENNRQVRREAQVRHVVRVLPSQIRGELVENSEQNETYNITRFSSSSISLIYVDPHTETISIKFVSTGDMTYIYRILDQEKWRSIMTNIQESDESERGSIGRLINQSIRDANLLLFVGRTVSNDVNSLGSIVLRFAQEHREDTQEQHDDTPEHLEDTQEHREDTVDSPMI